MSQVVLTIGGREYAMTCAKGEEAHIADLGRMVDAKLRTLPDNANQNDNRALLFAALLLADELHELRQSAGATAAPPAHLAAPVPINSAAAPGDPSPERLAALAERLEALAQVLEIAA